MRDERTNEQTLKIELLSQWKLEAEFRNFHKNRWKGGRCLRKATGIGLLLL